jgi:hypothetical protein
LVVIETHGVSYVAVEFVSVVVAVVYAVNAEKHGDQRGYLK